MAKKDTGPTVDQTPADDCVPPAGQVETKEAAEPTRAPRMQRVFAAECPNNPAHHTRVYNTEGKVRHCACDDCGHTWKQSGAYADPLTDFADSLIKLLETTESVVIEAGRPAVILIEVEHAKVIAWKLRELTGLKAPKSPVAQKPAA